MEKFIVSARKYRPQNFSTVVGQAHITTTLKNAIRNNQLAHAFLFCGPRGVGKTTCARILAKTINCENLQADGEACNACHSCVSFNNGSSLNIHELDAASNNSVDDIRALTDQVRFAPQAGKYKVYIIDEVHMLSASAFNAFLKTLEEPPPYAIFILATTEKHKILPTILSRCQIFDFKRITTSDTVEHLSEIAEKEHIHAEKAALQIIAQKSDGCMRDALSILDKIVSFTGGEMTYGNTLEHLNILDEDYYFRLLDLMQAQDLAGVLLLYDEINRKGFEGEIVLNGLAEFLRNLMVCQDERTTGLLEVVESFRKKYQETAGKVALGYLIAAINILNEAEINYKQARNKKLHIELTLIRLTYLRQAIELTGDEGAVSKKKRTESVKPLNFRQVPIVEFKKKDTGNGLPSLVKDPENINPKEDRSSGPKLNIESGIPIRPVVTEPAKQVTASSVDSADSSAGKPGIKMGALTKIRQQIIQQSQNEKEKVHTLNPDLLKKAWDDYIVVLTENKQHSTATSFKLAQLAITGETTFDIITETNIQQRFIEEERGPLVDHLQQFFNNRQISYQLMVKPSAEEPVQGERPLTKREQYLKMIEEYPLVKEFRDKLNLDLDF